MAEQEKKESIDAAETEMEQRWLFEPENKHLLDELHEGITQKPKHKLSFTNTPPHPNKKIKLH